MTTYFFDTYALFGLVEGNKNYENYSKNIIIITTKMNLFELHFKLLRDFGETVANNIFDRFANNCIVFTDEDIKTASFLKQKYKKLKISYVDALGFAIAKSRGMKFLTGDNAFKGLEGVEFVK